MGKEFKKSELLKLIRDGLYKENDLRKEVYRLRTALNRSRLENVELKAALGIDEMTGLLKKSVLYKMDFFEQESTIAMIDLDKFKKVNDTYGHPMGDVIIKLMADIIKDSIYPGDSPIRWGGDEFLIIFRNCPLEKAQDKCQQIVQRLEEDSKKAFEIEGINYFVSASTGLYYVDTIQSIDKSLKSVDDKLYEVKDSKRPQNRKKEKKKLFFKKARDTK